MNLKRAATQAIVIGSAVSTVAAKIDWLSPCTIKSVEANWNAIRLEMAVVLPFSWIVLGFEKYNKIKKLLGGRMRLPPKPDIAIQAGLLQIVGPDQMEVFIGPILYAYWVFKPCPPATPAPPAPTPTAAPQPTTGAPATSADEPCPPGYTISTPDAPTSAPPAPSSTEACPPGYTLSSPSYSTSSAPAKIYKAMF
ncbi:hypothetical protein GGI12_001159 [Dipsacomyces acuminosporus]|nr:hypothetical protein GGI12_001159 [Dipsacomyces acuminosporus]